MEPPWFKYQINKLILFLLRKSLKDHGLGLEFMGDLSSTMITIILLVGMVFSMVTLTGTRDWLQQVNTKRILRTRA